ncbi:MAG TPA: Crp/Fnr family transcriptional regulator [Hymenobacter sp.]|jgi:CRP-like cAMP-binding protein|uniref:Crp/Fnr family transcriptional regulator n=1 Tax=Hymenobacter sp. TaxID=1898978 RepID=UPI002ED92169
MTDLVAFLATLHPLSQGLTAALLENTVQEALPARHLLLRPGQVARRVYFLETGLVRGYTLLHGREVSSWFMQAGDFVISIVSFFTQQPSEEYLELLEPAHMHSISSEGLQRLYNEFPEFNYIGRRLMEKYYVLSEQRAQRLRSHTAAERYELLLRDFPTIFQRVSVQHIASHLGLAPETLSRLRGRSGPPRAERK